MSNSVKTHVQGFHDTLICGPGESEAGEACVKGEWMSKHEEHHGVLLLHRPRNMTNVDTHPPGCTGKDTQVHHTHECVSPGGGKRDMRTSNQEIKEAKGGELQWTRMITVSYNQRITGCPERENLGHTIM